MLSVLKTNFKIVGLLVCLVILAGVTAADAGVIYKGVVNSFKLNVRSAPSNDASVVVILEKGTPVDVLAAKGGIGGWLTVRVGGKKGYIRNRPKYILLEKVEAAKTKTAQKKPARQKLTQKKPVKANASKPSPKSAAREETAKAVVRETQEAIQTRIDTEKKRMDAYTRKEMEIIEGLNEIDYALNQAIVKADNLARETRELERSIAAIQTDGRTLSDQIEKNEAYAGERLSALYRMSMIGSLDMMTIPSSIFDFFLKQDALKRILKSDFEVLDNQNRDLTRLNNLETKLAGQKAAKTELEKDLNLQIRIKEKESSKKALILHDIRRKKALTEAALASLEVSARQLDEKMYAIEKQTFHPIDDSVFSRQKGRLPVPVKGRIISRFGPSTSGDYKSFTFKSGIDIKVERGEPVRSVFKGEVVFSDWLKGYGNLLIINHGENYYTLYAHVQEVFKKKGEKVDTGEVIATAGDTGSIKGLCLHFEVRHHGKPVNPMKWLSKGA